jgi:hypothetical protein
MDRYNTVYTIHGSYASIMPPAKGILWKYFLADKYISMIAVALRPIFVCSGR